MKNTDLKPTTIIIKGEYKMRQIRFGVFETNSSSTHSLTIVSKEEYENFKSGKLIWNRYFSKLQSVEDAKKDLVNERKKRDKEFEETPENVEKLFEEITETYDNFGSNYETFEKEYKTKSGEEVVAFGYFG